MTRKTLDSKNNNEIVEQRIRDILKEINQKLDYLIKLIREEELRYPFHQAFIESYRNKNHDKD